MSDLPGQTGHNVCVTMKGLRQICRFKGLAVTVILTLVVYISFYQLRLAETGTRHQLSRDHVDNSVHLGYHGSAETHNDNSFVNEHNTEDTDDWSKRKLRDWKTHILANRKNSEDVNYTQSSSSEHIKVNTRRVKADIRKPAAERDVPASTSNGSNETRHIAFLKVHKAGSSTIQNILYRFGLARNLTFVLSTRSHYLSKDKNNYNTIMPLPKSLGKTAHYDIACNHAVFNERVYRSWLYPDAEYVAIVREPVSLFLSAAYYYRDVWPTEYITALDRDTFIRKLIRYPAIHEPRDLTRSKTFNYMTRDFGFVFNSTYDVYKVKENRFEEFIKQNSETFKTVLVMEKFDESLVLLKRRFHWSIKDILYVKNNAYKPKGPTFSKANLTASDMRAFRRHYWMDIKLYDHFTSRFDNETQSEKGFDTEVRCFQNYLSAVQQFCETTEQSHILSRILLEGSDCSDSFYVTTVECSLMLLPELKFYSKLVRRHLGMH